MATIRFEERTHSYYLDDRRVPSVSEVLWPLNELEGIPRDELEAARIRGQFVHHYLHLHIHRMLEWSSVKPDYMPYVEAGIKFLREQEVRILHSEYRMADAQLRFAGTLDVLGIMQRMTGLFDWKAVSSMPRTAALQTAAYDHLYRRMMGSAGNRSHLKRYGVQLLPDGTYKVYLFEDQRDHSWFMSALNLWHWKNAA